MLYTFLRLSMFSIVQKIKMIKAPSSRAFWQMWPLSISHLSKKDFFVQCYMMFCYQKYKKFTINKLLN